MTVVSVFCVRPHRVFRELMRILKAQAGREGAYIASITVPTPQIFFFSSKHLVGLLLFGTYFGKRQCTGKINTTLLTKPSANVLWPRLF